MTSEYPLSASLRSAPLPHFVRGEDGCPAWLPSSPSGTGGEVARAKPETERGISSRGEKLA